MKKRISISQPGFMDEAPEATFISVEGDVGVLARIVSAEILQTALACGVAMTELVPEMMVLVIDDGDRHLDEHAVGAWPVALHALALQAIEGEPVEIGGWLITVTDDDTISRLSEAHNEAKGRGDQGAFDVWNVVRDLLVEAGEVER